MSPLFHGSAGRSFARFLMRALSVDELNSLYDVNSRYGGAAFARACLRHLGISYEIENPENLDKIPDGPFLTISNHPYGGIDGVILIDIFGHLYKDYKLMVNTLLGRVEALNDNMIRVVPNGDGPSSPTSESISGIKAAIMHVRKGHPLGLFPSGAVSDFNLKDMCIRDREWQEPVIRLIRRLDVPILPVAFPGRNSLFYYSLGLIDWRVRLLRLPSELFNKRGEVVKVVIGRPIMPQKQECYTDIKDFRNFLRSSVYELNSI